MLKILAMQTYARTGLTAQELSGATVAVFAKLSERFCGRLGISSTDIEQEHVRSPKTLREMQAPRG
ncbi:hypothetical protein [Inquilinus sp. Marseille-Q2685]|uniref:hypothetical protein n=1 Tax=Inquilinus sp. Marseille-Q2685 TaxID=2866581 RepID=UPI001CE415A5|nr:hypothetical protein [Inquilinus sp. Marseille-Q2685]